VTDDHPWERHPSALACFDICLVSEILSELHDFRSAPGIHPALRERGGGVGLATVDRDLVLMETGDVDVLTCDDGEAVYFRCPRQRHHHHVCRSCGYAIEITVPAAERWADAQVERLLALDGRYTWAGTWLVRHTAPPDLESLVTDLHAVNSGLLDAGFGSALLCTVICFTGGARPLALVYLYKRGTWYPFAPLEGKRRDNARELQVGAGLGSDLRTEPDRPAGSPSTVRPACSTCGEALWALNH